MKRALRLVRFFLVALPFLIAFLGTSLSAQEGGRLDMDQEFQLSKIGVIMLGVTDMEKSVSFYRDSLGLGLTAQHEGFAFFDAGGVTLTLSTGLAKAVGQAPGVVEVVFSVEHVRAAHQELQQRGVPFQSEPRPVAGPMWAGNFSDPDGHSLSVFGPE